MRATLVLCLIIASGCSTLPSVDSQVCGNGVLDPGEDCDLYADLSAADGAELPTACGAPEEPGACAFVCGESSACPAGWGCGTDGLCRAPSGAVSDAPGSPWRFPVAEFSAGDVDGDGFSDLIGNTNNTITVRFGAADGSFPDDLDLFTREPRGKVTFGDLSGDGLLDVVVPITGGFFAFVGEEDRDLAPVTYAPFDVGAELAWVVPMPLDFSLVTDLMLFLETSMVYAGDSPILAGATLDYPAGHILTDFAGRIPTANLRSLSGSIAGATSAALAFLGEDEIWVVGSDGDPRDDMPAFSLVFEDLSPDAGPQPSIALPPDLFVGPRGAQFVDVDGGGGIDLVVHVRNAAGARGTVIAFSSSVVQTHFAPFQAVDIPVINASETIPGRVRDVLALGDFTGDGVIDFVAPEGVFTSLFDGTLAGDQALPGTVFFAGVIPSSGRWTDAVTGDFNGDGVLDFAAASDDSEGIYVYLNTGIGIFNTFVVDTELPPTMLRAGDFDGDLVGDVAFVEVAETQSQLRVTFGATSGGLSEPVTMGTFPEIRSLEPARVALRANEIDLITDLVLVAAGDSSSSAAVLEGSSTRRMIAPFLIDGVVARRAIVGAFTDDEVNDVLAVTVTDPSADTGKREGELWLVDGLGDGQLAATADGDVEGIPSAEFDMPCSVWGSGPLTPDAPVHSVVSVDGASLAGDASCRPGDTAPRLFVGLPTLEASTAPIDAATPVSLDALSLRGASGLTVLDVDANGENDALIVFTGRPDSVSGETASAEIVDDGVAVLWNQDGALGGSITQLLAEGLGVLDVEAAHYDLDGIPDLLVLTRAGLYRARLDPSARTYGELELLFDSPGWRRMKVGDFNGDGLDDVALLLADQIQVFLQTPADPRGGIQ